MSIRPPDYGDQFPSDIDDTTPESPTTNYAEQDYDVLSGDGASSPPSPLNEFVPGDADEEIPPVPKTVYTGIIIQRANAVDPPEYWVLRQDGALGTARALYVTEFEEYRQGDGVSLIEDEAPDAWIIIGGADEDELCVVRYERLSNQVISSDGDTDIVWNDQRIRLPIDNTFGGRDDIKLKDGGVEFEIGRDCVVDVEVQIIVEYDNAKEAEPSDYAVGCVPTSGLTTAGSDVPVTSPRLNFSKQQGFKIEKHTNCQAWVSIDSPLTDAVLNDQGAEPFWTTCPKFGASLSIGTQVDYPWLKIKNFWLRGLGNYKLNFPNAVPPSEGAVLEVYDISGNCVSLMWRAQNLTGAYTGAYTAYCYESYCATYEPCY